MADGSVALTSVRSSMDRASDFGSEGWGFESLRARQTHSQTLDLRRQPCRVQDFRTRTVDAKT
jgi:hypothetical protein